MTFVTFSYIFSIILKNSVEITLDKLHSLKKKKKSQLTGGSYCIMKVKFFPYRYIWINIWGSTPWYSCKPLERFPKHKTEKVRKHTKISIYFQAHFERILLLKCGIILLQLCQNLFVPMLDAEKHFIDFMFHKLIFKLVIRTLPSHFKSFKILAKLLQACHYFSKLTCKDHMCAMVLQIILEFPLPKDYFKSTSF